MGEEFKDGVELRSAHKTVRIKHAQMISAAHSQQHSQHYKKKGNNETTRLTNAHTE